MPLSALALLLAAAVMHALWNFRLKRARRKLVVLWWGLFLGFLAFLPLAVWVPALPLRAWGYILASGTAQALYLGLLAGAYEVGDFSLVYPIARGSAPLFLTVWSVLFLHETPSGLGLAGLGVLSLGLMLIGSGGLLGRPSRLAVGLAVLVAVCISLYTAIDGAAVKITHPVSYFLGEWAASGLLAVPVLLHRYGRSSLLAELREERTGIVLVGLGMALAYVLALVAYSLAPVSYAGAVRESSVVFGSLLGWRWAGEGMGRSRLLGSLLIFAGIVLIAWRG